MIHDVVTGRYRLGHVSQGCLQEMGIKSPFCLRVTHPGHNTILPHVPLPIPIYSDVIDILTKWVLASDVGGFISSLHCIHPYQTKVQKNLK